MGSDFGCWYRIRVVKSSTRPVKRYLFFVACWPVLSARSRPAGTSAAAAPPPPPLKHSDGSFCLYLSLCLCLSPSCSYSCKLWDYSDLYAHQFVYSLCVVKWQLRILGQTRCFDHWSVCSLWNYMSFCLNALIGDAAVCLECCDFSWLMFWFLILNLFLCFPPC